MRYFSLILITALPVLLTPVARASVMSILPCESSDITVHDDDHGGQYDGISQSGTILDRSGWRYRYHLLFVQKEETP
ncbi:hypothetical protein MF265_01525 [Serratia marcescens]|uniref:hypothetical protein n=1 Tax=Serratia marcescens TaxID=615 RepID=UPI001EEFB296|nr:hypothetical protein [Serratia marcescens]ULH11503.1 hypothetical protein MF265_01525 [Serratia marcescens]